MVARTLYISGRTSRATENKLKDIANSVKDIVVKKYVLGYFLTLFIISFKLTIFIVMFLPFAGFIISKIKNHVQILANIQLQMR